MRFAGRNESIGAGELEAGLAARCLAHIARGSSADLDAHGA
jgi:hypothetical protein